ncbi:hypothetical protein [Streptomyces sp. ISL-11]|uniref:hypothetical protein n=1 Tax=Streptomyces sp. ISL-11 TaxID=2819174 RepID=UPI001BE67859|nr:hypothetical protein [Streptomyces sp. ISL-11]MBT2385370.1 hypothetical protein [Streptomyces sp. ISL-11]
MKLRHVRAAAIFGIAVVALTGARGHHGGSCSGGSSSHSSSSTSGGSTTTGGTTSAGTTGDLTSGGTTTGGTTTGGTTGGSTSSGSTSGITTGGTGGSASASRDLKIISCDYSDTRGITAKISVTNPSATDNYTYTFSVKFTDSTGTLIGTRNRTMPYVGPGKTETQDVSQSYLPKAGTVASGKCAVENVARTKS